MKLFTRVLLLALVAVLLCTSLVSCGKKKLEGEYVSDGGDSVMNGHYVSYVFDGKTFSFNEYKGYQKISANSVSGEYELEIIEQEDEEKQLEDEENGITRGNLILTWTDAGGATVTRTLPFVHDDYEGTLVVTGHPLVEGDYGAINFHLLDADEE